MQPFSCTSSVDTDLVVRCTSDAKQQWDAEIVVVQDDEGFGIVATLIRGIPGPLMIFMATIMNQQPDHSHRQVRHPSA